MKQCPYCGTYSPDTAAACSKCRAILPEAHHQFKTYRFGPMKARNLRSKALAAIAIGLLIRVYWGGYGPWPVIDVPVLSDIRPWLEPLLLYGGAVAYLTGWVLKWI